MILKIYEDIKFERKLSTTPQNEVEATYSLWRDEEDYQINWFSNSDSINRFIDAVGYPYFGAFSYVQGTKVRILDAEVYTDLTIENRTPGKVIFIRNTHPVVVCGERLLILKNVIYDKSGESFLPLKRLRVRFK